jgi:xanthomonalisin
MQLAIGLPIRDQAALDQFLREVADPDSPNFRQYLTPEQFTERFGPTQEEYDAVIRFAESRGLKVTNVHPNRLVVDVRGSVADVQRAFHIAVRNFRHPSEGRTFFAPDSDPVLDAPVPILQVSGLSNYWLRHPRLKIKPQGVFDSNPAPKDGTGPGGTYSGNDFRAAYLPGVNLTGAGQAVGLVEFDGYKLSNIFTYEQTANLPNVPLQNVLVDGYSGAAGNANSEVCLDIEVAIAMAPGLSQVIVYEAPMSAAWEDILSRIANDNQAKQISCSWGGGPPSAVAEQIFQQMAAQGQTFFNASGDDGAVVNGNIDFPNDSPNVVQVGGTSLATITNGGSYSYETTWTWGGAGQGPVSASGGGFSNVYPIPSWQQGVNMASNQGSTTFRNYPDVALTADNIYSVADNGQGGNVGGTSASAPLWAGFTALVNQQAAAQGKPPVGFINPVIYKLGLSPGYAALFHDCTTGDNITNQSGGRFRATVGYDLCTGWGTPTPSLISALISPNTSVTTYNITTAVSPGNAGTVGGAGNYPAGAQVTVTAAPYVEFMFTGWAENGAVVSTSPSYTFTVNSNRNLVAMFAVNNVKYSIRVFAVPPKNGTVFGAGQYLAGSLQTVYAFPKRGNVLLYWLDNGVPVSTDTFYSFTLDSDHDLIGVFGKGRAKGRGRRR